jgi:predicted small secreted protein
LQVYAIIYIVNIINCNKKITKGVIMKKSIKISALLISILAMTGCATVSTMGKDEPTTATAVTNTSATDTKAPTAKVSLDTNSHDQIIATIHTTYNGNPEGSVSLKWTAPKDSGCYSTEFPITKYGETKDLTWASVELKQGDKYCGGTWTASVVNNGSDLATTNIDIK